ncbi:MAG: hypothetical protein U0572_13095 [Phycisphaerales bacterium]
MAVDGAMLAVADPGGDGFMPSVAVYQYQQGDWSLSQVVESPEDDAQSNFGGNLRFVEGCLCVGARTSDSIVLNGGACYVYKWSGEAWRLSQQLSQLDPQPGDRFGSAVVDGLDRLFVAALGRTVDGVFMRGAVFVFQPDDLGGWVQEAEIHSPDLDHAAAFGYSIAVAGNRLFATDPGTNSVFVLEHEGDQWKAIAQLLHAPGLVVDQFGFDLSATATRVVVGVPAGENPGGPQAGHVEIFDETPEGWSLSTILYPTAPTGGQYFGASVALSDDGTLILVGAPNDSAGGFHVGSYSIFRLVEGAWQFQGKLFGDRPAQALGWSVRLDRDRAYLARGENNDALEYSGFVQLDCNGNGVPDACDIETGTSVDQNFNGTPDECELVGDLDGDGAVNSFDLGALLGAWGVCVGGCSADLDGDAIVGPSDLAILLGAWID